jgi:hypothetical protein
MMDIDLSSKEQVRVSPECPGNERQESIPLEDPIVLEAAQAQGDIPDGGLLAWTQVIMGHLIIFNSWGYITS